MFKQMALIKVKADAPPGKIEEIIEELKNLARVVPEVKAPEVVRITDSPFCDILFRWEFENREAHQRYIRHPFHGPMDERIRPFFEAYYPVRYDYRPGRD